jgi:hypothetical protein
MKTAMQELIDEVRKLRKNGFSVDDKYLQGLIEKEKEQIIKAMSYSTYREMKGINVSNEEYYNQTYNQNE